MKTKFVLIVLLVLCCCESCKTIQSFYPIKGGYKFTFSAPKGYTKEFILSSPHEYTQEYLYADSSIFFITNSDNTINYEKIRRQGFYHNKFYAFFSGDTLVLQGFDEKGLYWKDKLTSDRITIGYSRVHIENIEEFEKAVSTLKRIK